MKVTKIFAVWMLGSIIASTSFTACSDDRLDEQTTNVSNNVIYPATDVQVMESGCMSTEVSVEALTRAGGDIKPEDIKVTQLTELQAENMAVKEEGTDGKNAFYMYRWVTLRYKCKTADGTIKDLSELVVWPYVLKNRTPENLIVGCHITITSDAERPSNFIHQSSTTDINMMALFAHGFSQKALVIIPDYEGYGSTVSSPHPYCNRELTAEQVVTGAKAGLGWFESNITKMKSGWSSVAIGYSQGGAVAAGVLRYCQQHHEDGLRIKGAVCGDGPYDPLTTLKRYITMDRIYMPVAPALLLKGAIDTNADMQRLGCTYQDFVTDKFYQTNIFGMIQSKQKSTDEIQDELLKHSYANGDQGGFTMMALANNSYKPYTRNNAVTASGKKVSYSLENGKGYTYCTVDQCLKPAVIEYFRDGKVTGEVPEARLKALEKALAENALTAGSFTPGAGFTFFHSIGDEVVPYCNYESVKNAWGTSTIKGETYQSKTTLHVGTGKAFYLSYCGALVGELLNDKWAPSETNAGGGLW